MTSTTARPRIPTVDPPYEPAIDAQLRAMMPPGAPPIGLFRTFVHNLPMAAAMHGWGRHELGRTLSVSMRAREIVIDRTCARCGCEYEWGVHVAFFAERVGLDRAEVTSLTHGAPTDPCWSDEADTVLIELVDQLHDTNDVDDDLWQRLATHFQPAQMLDLLLLCGWYHAISFVARATRVAAEPGSPGFDAYRT
jgi:alkylhydroperoxidase family enzyme